MAREYILLTKDKFLEKKNRIIRSSSVSLKFGNSNKLLEINDLLLEYLRITQYFIDIFWPMAQMDVKIKSLTPKNITEKAETWFSARMVQACAKQASGIVRGTMQEAKNLIKRAEKLKKDGKTKISRNIFRKGLEKKNGKPELKTIEAQLDNRFFKFEKSNKTEFDYWLIIGSTGKNKITLPIRAHKHFNKFQKEGKILNSIRLSN
ncbi:MAG: hypothetical protein AABY22_26355, partial [Nanoarchaeota archaeon]